MNTHQTTSSACTVTDNSKKRIDNLFARFAAFYGHLWRSQFKHDGFIEFAKKEWLEGLKAFHDDVLHQAIIECRDYHEMPPTLPQLIRCCRDIKKRTTFYTAREPSIPASSDVVEASLNQCKAFLLK